MDKGKIEIISIAGMCEKYGVSHMTIYRHYIPKLKPIKKVGRKQYFLWDDVKKVHEELKDPMKNFKVIA